MKPTTILVAAHIVASMLMLATPALAWQAGDTGASVQPGNFCYNELKTLCGAVPWDGHGSLNRCLAQHPDKLNPRCRQALVQRGFIQQ